MSNQSEEIVVYFVRHGESEGNIAVRNGGGMWVDDYPDTSPLTETGKMQAEKAGEYLYKIEKEFDIIISSPFERAKNTAEIINKKLKKEIIFSDLCREIVGEPYFFVENEVRQKADGLKMVKDFRKIVDEFLEYLKSSGKKRILVVSHSMFIRSVLTNTIYGKHAEEDVYLYNFLHGLALANTGIVKMNYKEIHKTDNGWRVQMWNDTTHLKEL